MREPDLKGIYATASIIGREAGINVTTLELFRFRTESRVNKVVEETGCLHIGWEAKKDVVKCSLRGLFAPCFAVVKVGNARHARVQGAAPAAAWVNADAFISLPAKLDFAKRKTIAVEEFRNFVSRSQGFLFRAALLHGLRAQPSNALNDSRQIFAISLGVGARCSNNEAPQIIKERVDLNGELVLGDATANRRG